jgi:putative membrane protein
MTAEHHPWEVPPGRFQVTTAAETHFSWLRTRLSIERTLMSWVRTATSLIAFGFSIVQIYERFQHGEMPPHIRFPEAPRYFGLALLVAGVLALAVSIHQYRQMLHYLRSSDFVPIAGVAPDPVITPLLGVAILLVALGLFAIGSVLANFF